METQFLGDLERSTEIVLKAGGIHAAAAHPRMASGGAGRTLAISGLAMGQRLGNSLTRQRLLTRAERKVACWSALALLTVAGLACLFPSLVAVPLAVALAWISAALLIKAWRPEGFDQA